MRHRTFLYFPIEIAARELDARLLLAHFAVLGNAEVILGQKWLMETNLTAMPRGVWLFKTLTPRDSRVMRKIKACGHAVAAIDEEVTALAEGTDGLTWVSDAGISLTDKLFCQGEEHHKSLVGRWPEHASKYEVTGNPRWDLLRPELRGIFASSSEALRAAHGRIILINTNSSIGNPAKGKTGEQLIQELADSGKISLATPEQRAKWSDYLAFDRANLDATLKLVLTLSQRYPEHFIVLRPHPSEGSEFYRNGLAGLKNVGVIFDGSAATWIAAADVLIHTQCTTGIEAFALGKPAINFEVAPSPVNTRNISGRLSIVAQSEAEVLAHVAKRLAGAGAMSDVRKNAFTTFRRFFAAQDGELAAEKVTRQLATLAAPLGHQSSAASDQSIWRPDWTFRPRWRMSGHRRKVFPPVTAEALQNRLSQLAQALGHDETAQVTGIGDSLFHVRRMGTGAPPVGTMVGRLASRLLKGS